MALTLAMTLTLTLTLMPLIICRLTPSVDVYAFGWFVLEVKLRLD